MAKYAGKDGALLKDGNSVGLSKWELEIDDADVDATDYDSLGFAEFLSGKRKGTATASGPYNAATLGVSVGSFYTWTFKVGGSGVSEVKFQVYCKVSNIKVTSDANSNEPTGVTMRLTPSGAFTVTR